jgi:RNA recognition motif-containing protein
LYVGNLPYEIGETELQELFARAGSVESVTVMRDQATGRARGFAFVEMSTDDEAQTAIRELNASQVGGRSLTVNEARPKRLACGRRFRRRFGPAAVGTTLVAGGPWCALSERET